MHELEGWDVYWVRIWSILELCCVELCDIFHPYVPVSITAFSEQQIGHVEVHSHHRTNTEPVVPLLHFHRRKYSMKNSIAIELVKWRIQS